VLSYPLMALGLGYLGEGLAEEALPPLERAVAIRDHKERHPGALGEAHFALARALKQVGRDAPRARALALAARAEHASDTPSQSSQRWLAQIDAWLAADARAATDDVLAATTSRAPAPSASSAPARPLSGPLPS